ncbi:MAG: hypothetical protein R2849_07795 [Thermomicrobiales bacterium]
MPEHPEGYRPDWDAETDAEGWQETIDRFHADLADVIEITRDLTLNLDAEIPHAAGYTYLREILLVADHNSYHTGELAILRQVMDLWGDR